MKHFSVVLLSVIIAAIPAFAQLAQGPASGFVANGVVVSTEGFLEDGPTIPGPLAKEAHNKWPVLPLPTPANMPPPTGPEGSNYFEDPSVSSDMLNTPPPLVLASFTGLNQGNTGSFPPDPHIAVGPEHIISVINSVFRITTKTGVTLKTITANSWFGSTVPNVGSFDPKVLYDHHAGRWIMVWLHVSTSQQVGYYLVSVSDDDNPLGTWYNWALPSHMNGSTFAGNWGDYQGVGFDKDAIYITSNQFSFSSSYNYVKLRIVGKAQLYNNTAGRVDYTDFWNLRDLSGFDVFGARPTIVYSRPNEYYLVGKPNFISGSYFVVYRISNPLTSPTISAVHVPVVGWSNAPNANQLGGSTTLIEAGSSHLRSEPVYRDSSIWLVHSVASSGYSAVRYVRINTMLNLAIEDAALGAFGYWHFYNALAVDKDKNIAITFSRSGDTEYIGSYMTWRLAADPPGLRPTHTIQPGKGNYVRTGDGRNRWGDYNGIALDPVDQNNFWSLTEWAEGTNYFGNWIYNSRLVPFSGSRVATSTSSHNFGLVEAGKTGDTLSFAIRNYGDNTLSISSITRSSPNYTFVNLPNFPANIATFDSIIVKAVFNPTAHGIVPDTIRINSNDATNPQAKVSLTGKGVVIGRGTAGVMYAASDLIMGSKLFSVNTSTGVATEIGPHGITELHGLTIRPSNSELYGTVTGTNSTTLYRVSAGFGDALADRILPIGNMRAVAFGPGDVLYGGTSGGRLYRFNLATGDTIFIGTAAGIVYAGLSFNPVTGTLWASVRPPISNRDKIYRIDTSTGAATLVGGTGDNFITPSITFNPLGVLYGLKGSSTQTNTLIAIDTATAVGTTVGSMGVQGILAIAMRTDSLLTNVRDQSSGSLPLTYRLEQNYPNPFNPVTNFQFSIPNSQLAVLRVYSLLGEEIATLVNEIKQPGNYTVQWNASGLASGVYLYRLEAGEFRETKKLVLLK